MDEIEPLSAEQARAVLIDVGRALDPSLTTVHRPDLWPALEAIASSTHAVYDARKYRLVAIRPEDLSDCGNCHRCLIDAKGLITGFPLSRMILCPVCGNKRCPKASDHRLACTGSNESGQPGSVYASNADFERPKG